MHLSALPPLPGVSYIMPVLNEVSHLERAVRAILNQSYTGPKEIILALAPSSDGTDQVAQDLARSDPRVRLVVNAERDIPIGLNLAIAHSSYPVVIRVDAHSDLTTDYTSLGTEILRSTGAATVGGIMRAKGNTPTQRAIAAAYNSPAGLGGGAYHGDGEPGEAESAYLGIFHREALTAVGGYDPMIRRGEDWELNLRIRNAGGLIWFAPVLGVTYWPRGKFSDLSRQFYATGAWRAVLVRKYPAVHPWRFFVPGTLVIALIATALVMVLQLSGLLSLGWWSFAYCIPLLYLGGVSAAALTLPGIRGFRERARGAAALITMHVSWGTGFLKGLLFGAGRVVDRSRAR